MAQPPSKLHPYGLRHGIRHCPDGDDPMPCFEDYCEEARFPLRGDVIESEHVVFVAPFKCTVTALGFAPDETITGSDDNIVTFQFQNKGGDGLGVDVMAEKSYPLGVDIVAFDYDDFGAVSHAALEKDDVITLQKINTKGTVATPYLLVRVLFKKAA